MSNQSGSNQEEYIQVPPGHPLPGEETNPRTAQNRATLQNQQAHPDNVPIQAQNQAPDITQTYQVDHEQTEQQNPPLQKEMTVKEIVDFIGKPIAPFQSFAELMLSFSENDLYLREGKQQQLQEEFFQIDEYNTKREKPPNKFQTFKIQKMKISQLILWLVSENRMIRKKELFDKVVDFLESEQVEVSRVNSSIIQFIKSIRKIFNQTILIGVKIKRFYAFQDKRIYSRQEYDRQLYAHLSKAREIIQQKKIKAQSLNSCLEGLRQAYRRNREPNNQAQDIGKVNQPFFLITSLKKEQLRFKIVRDTNEKKVTFFFQNSFIAYPRQAIYSLFGMIRQPILSRLPQQIQRILNREDEIMTEAPVDD